MSPYKFNFRKTIKRNTFTTVFQTVGKRRRVMDFTFRNSEPLIKRFKMQMIRRSKQGWRNKQYGATIAMRHHAQGNRYPVISQFRRN